MYIILFFRITGCKIKIKELPAQSTFPNMNPSSQECDDEFNTIKIILENYNMKDLIKDLVEANVVNACICCDDIPML